MKGKVIELFITLDDANKTRKNVSAISIDKNGIIDDKFYNKNLMRSILITSLDSYKLSKTNGIALENGLLGENILIDINPYSLTAGSIIRVGDAKLEITQNCTLCKGLSTLNPKLPSLLKNDRGIFAKLIQGNYEIQKGDTVEILNH